MFESVRTIISNKYISFLLSTGGDYACCVLPRYDAYLFSQAIKESIKRNNSINFESNSMNIDIMNLNGTFIFDCTNKETTQGFQITCLNAEGIAESLEEAAIKGKEQFGSPPNNCSKWAIFNTLSDSE